MTDTAQTADDSLSVAQGYKTFSMLNSAELESLNAH